MAELTVALPRLDQGPILIMQRRLGPNMEMRISTRLGLVKTVMKEITTGIKLLEHMESRIMAKKVKDMSSHRNIITKLEHLRKIDKFTIDQMTTQLQGLMLKLKHSLAVLESMKDLNKSKITFPATIFNMRETMPTMGMATEEKGIFTMLETMSLDLSLIHI